MWNKIKPFIISSAVALCVGSLSALLSKNGMEKYGTEIIQPSFSPPMWLFPIVWSILYILMGVGSALIFTKVKENRSEAVSALTIYGFQLIVNFFWSLIFFNMRAFLFAFVWLLILIALIVLMILRFAKIMRIAAILQLPYLLWAIFAAFLTFAVYWIN